MKLLFILTILAIRDCRTVPVTPEKRAFTLAEPDEVIKTGGWQFLGVKGEVCRKSKRVYESASRNLGEHICEGFYELAEYYGHGCSPTPTNIAGY